MTDIMQLPKWQRFDEVQRKKAQKHLVYGAGAAGLAASGMGAARWGAQNAGPALRSRGVKPPSVLGRAARVARGAKFGRALGATSAAAGLLGAGSTLTWGASLGREIKRDEAKLRQQNLVKAAFMSDEEFEKAFGLGAAKTLGSKMWKPLKAAGSNAAAGWRGAAPAKGLNGLKAAGVRAQGAGQAAWGGMSQPMKYGTVGVLSGGAGLGLSQLNKASKRSMAQEALLANPEFQAGYARQMGEQTANAQVARDRSRRRRKRLVKLGALGLIGYGAYRSGVFKADDWRSHVSPEALEGYRYLKRGERDKKQLAAGPMAGASLGLGSAATFGGAIGLGHVADKHNFRRAAPGVKYPGFLNRLAAEGDKPMPVKRLKRSVAVAAAIPAAYGAFHAARVPAAVRQWQEANRWRGKADKIKARGEQRMAVGKALSDQQRLSLAPAAGGVAGAGLLASGLRGRSGVRLSEFDWLQPPGPGNKSFNFSIKTRGAGRKGRKLADQKLRDLYDVLDSHKIGERAAGSSRELVGSVHHKPFLGRPGRAAAGAALLAGSAALAPAAVRQWRGRREVGKSLVEVSKWGAKIHPVSRIVYGYEGETPDTIAMRSDGRTMFGRNKYRTMVVPGEQYGKDKGLGVYRLSPNAFKLSRRQRRMLKGRAKDISGLKTDYSGVLSKAAPQLRVKPLIMRGSPVRRGTFVRKPVGQMTYRRGSL